MMNTTMLKKPSTYLAINLGLMVLVLTTPFTFLIVPQFMAIASQLYFEFYKASDD